MLRAGRARRSSAEKPGAKRLRGPGDVVMGRDSPMRDFTAADSLHGDQHCPAAREIPVRIPNLKLSPRSAIQRYVSRSPLAAISRTWSRSSQGSHGFCSGGFSMKDSCWALGPWRYPLEESVHRCPGQANDAH
eukprot:6085923-Pyramimonas_sp.AAC.1